MPKNTSHDYNFWLSIILVFLALLVGTSFHDPILHSVIIWINGWELGAWQTGLLTGNTEALIAVASMDNIPTLSLFIFYMFPASFIFVLVYLLTIRSTSRFILIIGLILLGLNISSLSPSITGSDASEALKLLILRSWNPITAYLFMYSIFVVALLAWAIFIYIAIENNPSDARRRMNYIIGNR